MSVSRGSRGPRAAAALLIPLLVTSSACAVRPAAEAGAPPPATGAEVPAHRRHTPADVHFMQGMIVHHGQALEMTALVPERTTTRSILLLAERIEVSQQDEIAQMRAWLESRGEPAPGAEAAAGHGHAHGAAMSGMLSAEQMESLAGARGAPFDRLFLELMIQHHRGAIEMVDALFASPGAGQEVDVFRIASEVDSDQRIEIERMERMLQTIG